MNRRNFLILSALSAAATQFPALAARTSRPMKILMLGGTGFVGPHLVRTALERGHEVTLFNRGQTNPHLFPVLEKLRGNRYPDRDDGLAALANDRQWDLVLDTWQQAPGCVAATDRLLRDRIGQYLYISSIASYRNYREMGMSEDSPILDVEAQVNSLSDELGYSDRKAAAEHVVLERRAGPGIVLRCGSIRGPGVPPQPGESVELGYWDYRFATGRSILAPAEPDAHFQLIDVRDLAEFAISVAEQGLSGPFNLVGPGEPIAFPEFLRTWNRAVDGKAELAWANREFLDAHGIRPWVDLRNWIPGDSREPGFYHISNARAVEAGLTFRPVEQTLRDSLPPNLDAVALTLADQGMSLERETELIAMVRDDGR